MTGVSVVIDAFLGQWRQDLGDLADEVLGWYESLEIESPQISSRERNARLLLLDLMPTALHSWNWECWVADEERRAWLALDWLVRDHAPRWLRRAGFEMPAEILVTCTEVRTPDDCIVALAVVDKAKRLMPSVEVTVEDAGRARGALKPAAGQAALKSVAAVLSADICRVGVEAAWCATLAGRMLVRDGESLDAVLAESVGSAHRLIERMAGKVPLNA